MKELSRVATNDDPLARQRRRATRLSVAAGVECASALLEAPGADTSVRRVATERVAPTPGAKAFEKQYCGHFSVVNHKQTQQLSFSAPNFSKVGLRADFDLIRLKRRCCS